MDVDEDDPVDLAFSTDPHRSTGKRKLSDFLTNENAKESEQEDLLKLHGSAEFNTSAKKLKVCVVDLTREEVSSALSSTDDEETTNILTQVLDENILSSEDNLLLRKVLERRQSIDMTHSSEKPLNPTIEPFSCAGPTLQRTYSSVSSPEAHSPVPISNSKLSQTSSRSRASSFALVIVPRSNTTNNNDSSTNNQSDSHTNQSMSAKSFTAASMVSSNGMSNVPAVDCAICHTDVCLTEPGSYCILPCRHAYHQSCIKPWFQTQLTYHNNIDCPRCRTIIPYRPTASNSDGAVDNVDHNVHPMRDENINQNNNHNNANINDNMNNDDGNDNRNNEETDNANITSNNDTSNTGDNFLVDNDLLPQPHLPSSGNDIFMHFIHRLDRHPWDDETKIVFSLLLLTFGSGSAIGLLVGSIAGSLIGWSARFDIGARVCRRLLGEIFAIFFFSLYKNANNRAQATWFARLWKVLLYTWAVVGHMYMLQAFARRPQQLDDYTVQCITRINTCMMAVIAVGYFQHRVFQTVATVFLQAVLTYYMIWYLPSTSFMEDIYFGFTQQIVFMLNIKN